ncbi:nucleotidyltransferase family protein [Seongchinamella unica]|uniref:nucleotidyltransferase family protein n=1 Tax=Seongchinamella unica TaxID=2547392 RepID=UPI0014047BB3|nr:nucleotidyltransferase family protein [Seongchinamella unica]
MAPLAYEFAPYFYYLLNQLDCFENIPESLQQLMRDSSLHAASVAIARRHVIEKLGRSLKDAGIEAILLKGAAMDRWTYPEQAFRLGGDVDLLVRESDYHTIDKILAPIAKRHDKFPGQPAFSALAVEKPFVVSSPTKVCLDVHRNLTIPHVYNIDLEGFFDRATPHPAKSNFLVMSPEDNLLHFAVHSFYDMRLFNKQTMDAAQLMEKTQINWDALLDSANRYKMQGPLKLFLWGLRSAFTQQQAMPQQDIDTPSLWKQYLTRMLLTASNETHGRKGKVFRFRQVTSQIFLSGDIAGYTRYNIAYAAAKMGRITAK